MKYYTENHKGGLFQAIVVQDDKLESSHIN